MACAANPRTTSESGTIPITEARGRAIGSAVAVEGVVTVPAGVVDGGFVIQDATAGIFVADSAARHGVGTRVRAAGALMEANGLLGIRPTASTDALGHGALPAPRRVRTADVGETTEGVLITVEGVTTDSVADDQPYGWKIHVDDGSGPLLVFIATGTRIDVASLRAGQRLRVTGLSGQYDAHHEILPRSQADVVALP